MAVLIRNSSTFNYSWDGIDVNAGVILDVTGWDLTNVVRDAGFIKLVNDVNSGISVVDAGVVLNGTDALQALQVEPCVRTVNGLSGDVLLSTATISSKSVSINGKQENIVFESGLVNYLKNTDVIDGGTF